VIHDIAWAAGLYEGEGTATQSGGRPRLAVKMYDPEPLYWFHEVVGYGKVYGPYDRKVEGEVVSTYYTWVAQRPAEAWEVAQMLYPWLSMKRKTAIDWAFSDSWRPRVPTGERRRDILAEAERIKSRENAHA
jgi:hypothetical protein